VDLSPLPWQQDAWRALHALRERGAQAILLHGAAGIGKFRLARAFGAALLCEAPSPTGGACGRCAACALTSAGTHPDLRVVVPQAWAHLRPGGAAGDDDAGAADEAAGGGAASGAEDDGPRASREIKVEAIHALVATAAVTSHRGGVRVALLYPADALNAVAGNALLKTLEEPPGDTLFLLVTDTPEDLLPTLRSRCLRVPVAPPEAPQALAWLQTQGLAPEQARARLAQAGGAPLWALEPPVGVLEDAVREQLLALLRKAHRLTTAEIAGAVGKNVPVAAAIALFQRWGMDLLTLRHAGRVLYHAEDARGLSALGGAVSDDALFVWLDELAVARRSADHPLNARLVIEQALIRYRAAIAPGAAGVSS